VSIRQHGSNSSENTDKLYMLCLNSHLINLSSICLVYIFGHRVKETTIWLEYTRDYLIFWDSGQLYTTGNHT
jgi:hypothetical protein